MLDQVRVLGDRLEIVLFAAGIAELLEVPLAAPAAKTMTIAVEARLTRTGRALRLVQGDRVLAASGERDPALVKLVLKARRWWDMLARGQTDIKTLSRAEGVTASYMTRVIRLAFLAPEVTDAVLNGELKAGVGGQTLLHAGSVPELWSEQRDRFISGP